MNTAGMNTARSLNTGLSSEAANANPLEDFTSFDRGDLANILHDLRNSVRDLTTRMNSGLTPAVAGLSFTGRQGVVPPPINIQAPPPAPPGPYSADRSQPPHIPFGNGPRYVPPHRAVNNAQRDDRFSDLPS